MKGLNIARKTVGVGNPPSQEKCCSFIADQNAEHFETSEFSRKSLYFWSYFHKIIRGKGLFETLTRNFVFFPACLRSFCLPCKPYIYFPAQFFPFPALPLNVNYPKSSFLPLFLNKSSFISPTPSHCSPKYPNYYYTLE